MEKRTKSAQLAVRLTEEQAHKFKVRCAIEKTTIQEVLERAVEDFLNRTEKPE